MSKSIIKLLASFGTAICFVSFLGITTTRSQPVSSEGCLSKSPSALTIEKAIEDASKPESCERSTNLIPIIPTNPRLIWRKNNGQDQVLMVTWKGDCDSKKLSISCKQPGETYAISEGYPLWVTAVPEVKEFVLIQDYSANSHQTASNLSAWLSSRLKQYLGLRPDDNYTKFVEIWVNVQDLQRPCSNSKISSTECNFPEPGSGYDPQSNTKYPFTGLGYTYDWGNPNTDIGASEFIVKAPATVTIHSIQSTSDYLQGLTPRLLQQK
jgi:hypothetical protein